MVGVFTFVGRPWILKSHPAFFAAVKDAVVYARAQVTEVTMSFSAKSHYPDVLNVNDVFVGTWRAMSTLDSRQPVEQPHLGKNEPNVRTNVPHHIENVCYSGCGGYKRCCVSPASGKDDG
jgi:hypothetical protein